MSNRSARVSVRMTPAWRKSASVTASLAASAPVWEAAARWPAALRPDLTATIGLRAASRLAMRPKRRGLPKDSRYSATTSVASSSSKASSRSFEEMSALLPVEANSETPSPRARAPSSTAIPSAPDCDAMATFPSGGRVAAKVASNTKSGRFTSRPRQFGPSSRT